MKIKTLALSIAIIAGSSQSYAFSFVETTEPEMGSVPAEEYMNKSVEPVTTPVTPAPKAEAPAEGETLQEQLAREARERAEREAELARQERLERERLEREMAEKARQERLAKEKAEREARLAAERAKREQAERDRKALVNMRNEGIQMIGDLNLVEMSDRLKFKSHYDRMVELAGGDKQNKHIKDFGILGARAYYNDALDHVQEQGQYLFSSREQGKEWGFALKTGITEGEYVEIMKTFPDRVETGLTMINLAEKYANVEGDVHEFVQFRKYLNWRQDNMQKLLDHAESLQANPEYDPDRRMNGLTLGDVGKKAWDVTKDVGGSIVDGVKGIADRCFWNCS